MKIGKILGIDIALDWSVLILVLMLFNGLNSMFAVKLAEFVPSVAVIATCITIVGLLASILAHELGHAYVGQKFGLTFHSITLHAFGGAANMSSRMPSAKGEFFIAIAGPLVSVVLGVLLGFTSIGAIYLFRDTLPGFTLFLFRILSVLSAINISLGVFNMIPAFPLDGGRVLRSAVWKYTGSYLKATEIAAKTGFVFGSALVGCGALMALDVNVPMFGVGLGDGLWLAIIGLLVIMLARNEVRGARLGV
jgi:Zn-dependent protease